MIKTLTNLLKQDKEKFVVPKGVQDCIPITAIYDDGIFRVGKDKYSKLYEMTSREKCPFVLWVGNRRMIKRRVFDEYIEKMYSI